MWESRRDFQVLWADAVSVHQDGISTGWGGGPREGPARFCPLEDNCIMSSQGSIALYDALRDAQGVSEEKARAAASSGPAADNLATSEDLTTAIH